MLVVRRVLSVENYLSESPEIAVEGVLDFSNNKLNIKQHNADEMTANVLEDLELFLTSKEIIAKFLRRRKRLRSVFSNMYSIERWQSGPTTSPVIRTSLKYSRNDPCPCGSGKKIKKCCIETLRLKKNGF